MFSLKPEKKIWRKSVLSFSRKTKKTHTLILKNDVTEPNAMLYSNYAVNRLKNSFRLPETMV